MALFSIKNQTGKTLKYRGNSYGNGTFVPITEIIKGGYSVQRAKLWGKDSGRSMTGKYQGTLIGIFLKITVKVSTAKLSSEDIATLVALQEQTFASIKYYDTKSRSTKTAEFYFDDVNTVLNKSVSGRYRYESIDITAVAVDKYK